MSPRPSASIAIPEAQLPGTGTPQYPYPTTLTEPPKATVTLSFFAHKAYFMRMQVSFLNITFISASFSRHLCGIKPVISVLYVSRSLMKVLNWAEMSEIFHKLLASVIALVKLACKKLATKKFFPSP